MQFSILKKTSEFVQYLPTIIFMIHRLVVPRNKNCCDFPIIIPVGTSMRTLEIASHLHGPDVAATETDFIAKKNVTLLAIIS